MANNTIIRKATSEGAGRRCHMVQRPLRKGEWNKKQKAKQRIKNPSTFLFGHQDAIH